MRRGFAVVVLVLAALAFSGCALARPKATTSVTGAGATLNGDVYSDLGGNTDYWWRYGTGTSYGSETPHRTVAINNTQAHPVSEPVTGLSPSTAYHFQMCARDGSNPPRAVCSSDGTFTTLAPVGERALAVAEQYRGTPFVYGGASPATGFDDTGLVQYSFGQVGVALPRVAYQQVESGTAVAPADLRRGDLVFFSTDMSGVANHAGIFEGNGMFLHAPHTGDVIRSASITDPFYMHTFLAGRRISG